MQIQIFKAFSIPTKGTKDQLVLRVLAVRTGTRHLLFERETRDLLSLLDLISSSLIWKEKEQAFFNDSSVQGEDLQMKEEAAV